MNSFEVVIGSIRFGNKRWAEELERSPNFQVQAYTLEVLLESVSLVAIRDPADRAIVATARHLRCPLITADETARPSEQFFFLRVG
jgi:PIN domain nuclease of toxin-antitoxin system